jgi:hypothetical protein
VAEPQGWREPRPAGPVPVRRPGPPWLAAILDVQARHPAVKLTLAPAQGGARRVSLALIQLVPGQPRRTGLARAALADLCRTADWAAVTLTLTPTPLGGGISATALRRWYAAEGFGPYPARERDTGPFGDTWRRLPR